MGTLFEISGTTGVVDFKSSGTTNLVLENGTSVPGSGIEGHIFWKSDTDVLYVYNGSSYLAINGATAGGWTHFSGYTQPQTLSDQIQFGDGSASIPSISFSSDTNTGLYWISANDLGFSTDGTLRFDISTSALTSTLPLTLSPTTNQLVLGTTRTVTLTAPTPATSSRTHTIPDVGTNSNFVMTDGTQTFNKTVIWNTGQLYTALGSLSAPGLALNGTDKFSGFTGGSNGHSLTLVANQLNALTCDGDAATISTSTFGLVLGASTTFSSLTATTVPYLDSSKILTSSSVTPTELGYVSGVTSAIQTQINNNKTYLNVKAYGATGNGITDDTIAVQNALTAALAANATLFFPAGTYLVTALSISPIDYQSINIVGAGPGQTILKRTGATSSPMLTIDGSGGNGGVSQIMSSIRNITFFGVSNAGDGIYLKNIWTMKLDSVFIRVFDRGLILDGAQENLISNCFIFNNNTGITAMRNGTSGVATNHVKLLSSFFETNSTYAINLDKITAWEIDGCTFTSNGAAGNAATGTIISSSTGYDASVGPGLAITNCWFEFNAGNAEVKITSVGSPVFNSINSCMFNGNVGNFTYSIYIDTGRFLAQNTIFYQGTLSDYTVKTINMGLATFQNCLASKIDLDSSTQSWPPLTTGAFPQIYTYPGVVSAPGYAFNNSGGTGMYLITPGDLGFTTNGTKRFEISTAAVTSVLPFIASSTTGNRIHGDASNSAVAAGDIGEVIESIVGISSTPANATYGDLTSISLTAGKWSISFGIIIKRNGATFTSTDFQFGIGTASGTGTTGLIEGDNTLEASGVIPTTFLLAPFSLPDKTVYLSGNQTYYLKAYLDTFTAGTPQYYCRMTAIRIA